MVMSLEETVVVWGLRRGERVADVSVGEVFIGAVWR